MQIRRRNSYRASHMMGCQLYYMHETGFFTCQRVSLAAASRGRPLFRLWAAVRLAPLYFPFLFFFLLLPPALDCAWGGAGSAAGCPT